jgi:hypothetical protein
MRKFKIGDQVKSTTYTGYVEHYIITEYWNSVVYTLKAVSGPRKGKFFSGTDENLERYVPTYNKIWSQLNV